MNNVARKQNSVKKHALLSCAVAAWICMPAWAADTPTITTKDVLVEVNAAQEDAKYESQQKTIITAAAFQTQDRAQFIQCRLDGNQRKYRLEYRNELFPHQ